MHMPGNSGNKSVGWHNSFLQHQPHSQPYQWVWDLESCPEMSLHRLHRRNGSKWSSLATCRVRQELSVLRGAMRILRKSPKIIIVLQLYGRRLRGIPCDAALYGQRSKIVLLHRPRAQGPESGVIRDPTYDPCRPVRWLVHRGGSRKSAFASSWQRKEQIMVYISDLVMISHLTSIKS